jgi:hypothetical protein
MDVPGRDIASRAPGCRLCGRDQESNAGMCVVDAPGVKVQRDGFRQAIGKRCSHLPTGGSRANSSGYASTNIHLAQPRNRPHQNRPRAMIRPHPYSRSVDTPVQGVGGEYNLFLPERGDVLSALPQEILLRYTILEGKYLAGAPFTGRLVKLSARGAEIHSEHPVPPWSDLKMQLIGSNREKITGDLYGKVVWRPTDSRLGFFVRFTSISPEVTTFSQSLPGSLRKDTYAATLLRLTSPERSL